jgi:hypothetical protein
MAASFHIPTQVFPTDTCYFSLFFMMPILVRTKRELIVVGLAFLSLAVKIILTRHSGNDI